MSPGAATLRRGRPEDAAAVARIWHDGWMEAHLAHVPAALAAQRTAGSFRARAEERVGEMTVAEVGGELAGFVLVVGDEVEQVYVAAAHRGSGVAGLLLAEAERQVAASGHREAWLAVVPANARARRFYERSGWRDEGPFEHEAPVDGGSVPVPCHRYVKRLEPRREHPSPASVAP